MKVIIQGVPQDIKVTSIVLEADSLNPDMLSMFYCPKCGKSLFQYSGNVVMIVPGATVVAIPFIRQCKICKTKYLINSLV